MPPPGLELRRCSAACRLINFGAHTDGTLSWVKNVAVPEAGAPMALRMFAGTYAVPEAGAPMASRMFAGTYAVPEAGAPIACPVLCQSFERLGPAVPFGLGVIEGQVHGWRLALNPVPFFACTRIRKILRVRAGLSSAGTRARTGRHWSAGLRHGAVSESVRSAIKAFVANYVATFIDLPPER